MTELQEITAQILAERDKLRDKQRILTTYTLYSYPVYFATPGRLIEATRYFYRRGLPNLTTDNISNVQVVKVGTFDEVFYFMVDTEVQGYSAYYADKELVFKSEEECQRALASRYGRWLDDLRKTWLSILGDHRL